MLNTGQFRLHSPLLAACVAGLLAAVAAAGLIWRIEEYRLQDTRATATNVANDYAVAIERNIQRALTSSYTLAGLVRHGKGSVFDFKAIATEMLPLYPSVSELALAPGGLIQSVAPLSGNESALNVDLLQHPAQKAEALRARESGSLTLAGPLDLVQGGVGVVGRLPVFLDDPNGKPHFWGFALTVIPVSELIRVTGLARLAEQGYVYELWRIHPDSGQKQTISASSSEPLIEPVAQILQVPNSVWTLSVMPVKGWGDPLGLSIKIALGILFSLLLAYLSKLMLEARIHANALEDQVVRRTAEVRTRELELNQAQSIARIGSWVFDPTGKALRLSLETYRILGLSTGLQLDFKEMLQQVDPDDRDAVDRAWHGVLNGERCNIDFRLSIGAGIRWLHAQADLQFAANGTQLNCVGTVEDITERKRAEEEIRLTSTILKAQQEASLDAILVVDENGKIISYNHQFIDLWRLSPKIVSKGDDAPVLQSVVDQVENSEAFVARVQYLYAHRDEESREQVRLRDGRTIDRYSAPVTGAGGKYHGRVWYFRDISERVRAQMELREAAQRFRALVEQAIAGMYIIQDGKLAYVNQRAAEILGQGSPDELIGTDPLAWIAEADRGMVAEYMRRLLDGESQHLALDFGALRRDGVVIQVGANAARAVHEGCPAIIGLLQDISEKRRAEEEIKRYVARLEQAMQSTINVVATIGEQRDPYTHGHERRVGEVAAAIAAEMALDANRVEGIRVAGYLHDVGKISVPAEILAKPTRLTKTEFELVKDHAQRSYEILKGVQFPWPVAEIAWQHHERLDGSGYPRGLKGNAIILEARIMSVADVVEAMASHRPYRPGLGIDKALAEIEHGRGTLYDPVVADACLRLFREKGYSIPA